MALLGLGLLVVTTDAVLIARLVYWQQKLIDARLRKIEAALADTEAAL